MKSSWNKYKIKQLADIINGYSFKSELYQDAGINVVRITNVDDGNINKNNPRFYSFEYEKEIGKAMLLENDILMSLTGNVGIVGIVKREILPAGLNQRVASIRIKDRNILYKFLYYYFRTNQYKEKAILNSQGIAQLNLSTEWIGNDEILVPSIVEQQNIVNILDEKILEIDNIIAKTKETIEDYKKYKEAIITETVTKGLHRDSEMKDSKVEMIGDIPITWNIQKLKTFISIPVIDGPHESPQLYDSGIPYISATAIENGKINFELMRGYISEEYCNQCDVRYKPEINDILVIKLGATTGQVAIVDTDKRFNIWVPLAAIRCNSSVNPKFIYYCFQSLGIIRQMELMWTFGTQQTLGVKTIEQLMFAIPSKCEQDSIVKYLEIKCKELNNLIESKEKIIEELERYKKSLIYEYVTGKKEVI